MDESSGVESCPNDMTTCASSEWAQTRKLGQTSANKVFLQHWRSWFTQDHAYQLKDLKLDHIHIPLGFYVFLDMHALPGVAAKDQMFAGNVTSEVEFYQDYSYQCALTWSAILMAMTHLDPDFQNVVGIECVNEPLSNATLTPGLEQYYADFITMTRVIEYALGVRCETDLSKAMERSKSSKNVLRAIKAAISLFPIYVAKAGLDHSASELVQKLTSFLKQPGSVTSTTKNESPEDFSLSRKRMGYHNFKEPSCHQKLLRKRIHSAEINPAFDVLGAQREKSWKPKISKSCITTIAMSKQWQWAGPAASMVPHTIGPAAYDDHMYYSFGGMADANFYSYMQTMCNQDHLEQARKSNEIPYCHGEFSLATDFNATDDQLRAWGDAQRFWFSQENYWTFKKSECKLLGLVPCKRFWSFRLGAPTEPDLTPQFIKQWSYLQAVESGVWPREPSEYFNPSVCEPYINNIRNANNTY
ncbi:hypothetical protein O181_076581 [Austropuccinia psidii MF-1]|uniref:Glycoside hydrolase family 5 domain-containing protein n=1 Tax=Austropuccinia psidii MF-1 TaxID=1389203 RepID=A0A9Q3FAP0_9BASI|nr:hypothetical protein [Austropuccinia psidii MF-1]